MYGHRSRCCGLPDVPSSEAGRGHVSLGREWQDSQTGEEERSKHHRHPRTLSPLMHQQPKGHADATRLSHTRVIAAQPRQPHGPCARDEAGREGPACNLDDGALARASPAWHRRLTRCRPLPRSTGNAAILGPSRVPPSARATVSLGTSAGPPLLQASTIWQNPRHGQRVRNCVYNHYGPSQPGHCPPTQRGVPTDWRQSPL